MIKHDKGKIRYDLVPPGALRDLAAVLTYGAETHGEEIGGRPNFLTVEHPRERYYSALMRHLEAWRAGETLDVESGLPTLAHALANVAFLIETERFHGDGLPPAWGPFRDNVTEIVHVEPAPPAPKARKRRG